MNFTGTTLSGAGTYTLNKAAGTFSPGPITSPANLTLIKAGTGSVVLDNTATAQLTAANTVLRVQQGDLVALGQNGGLNPLGTATVSLEGGTLALSSKGGDVSFANAITATVDSTISAGQHSTGVAGPLTASHTGTLSVPAGVTLNATTADNYSLVFDGDGGASAGVLNVTGSGVAAVGGVVNPIGAMTVRLNGGDFGVSTKSTPFTFNNAFDIVSNSSITARQAGSGLAGPADVTLGASLNVPPGVTLGLGSENNYTLHVGGNVSVNGGSIEVQAGIADLSTVAINGSALVTTPVASALRGTALNEQVNLGIDNDNGIADVLRRTPTAARDLNATQFPTTFQYNAINYAGNGDLAFGGRFGADGKFTEFFQTGITDAFTTAFTGKFTAADTGVHGFGFGINDDGGALWLDLNLNGVFERNGSAGDELVMFQGGCCGPSDDPTLANIGTANLVAGQSYKFSLVLQDTGGGSSLAGRFSTPSVAETFINPGSQPFWSYDTTTGGARVVIAGGAELRVGNVTNASDVNLAGNNAVLRLSSAVPAAGTVEVLRNSNMGSGQTATIELGANNALTVNRLTVMPGSRVIKSGLGLLASNGTSIGAGGVLEVAGGVFQANSGGAVFGQTGAGNTGTIQIDNSGILTGTGTVGDVTVEGGGTVSPGSSAGSSLGTLHTGDLSLLAGGTILVQIAGTDAGQYDRVQASGDVALGGASLALLATGGFTNAPLGAMLFIIENSGFNPVTGTFAGLAQGSLLHLGDQYFEISYEANFAGEGAPANSMTGGNDVGLIAVPEPHSFALLGLAALLALARRRRS